MKAYIRENLKIVISVTAVLVCTIMLIGTNELVAQILPHVSDMTLVSYTLDESTCAYTGKEVKPEILEVVLADENNKEIVKTKSELIVTKYSDNVDCGYANMEVSVNGFQDTLVLRNAFKIQPAQVKGVKITQETREAIDVSWEKVFGADGYYVYKSYDSGANYTLIADVPADGELKYQDTQVQFNARYMYYVSAYIAIGDDIFKGQASENITQNTPLATPVLSGLKNVAYNTIGVQWNAVEGAVGYQVYRSFAENGEYTCIAEIADGAVTYYADTTCQCGVKYYYYIKACQLVDAEMIYGEASQILSGKTTPNKVSLSGSGTEIQVELSWTQSGGAQGYEIYRSVHGTSNYKLVTAIGDPSVLTWTDSGLDAYTSYYYRVRPYYMLNGILVCGPYSDAHVKEAVVIYDYSGVTGVDILKQYVGRPYVYGGTSPTKGWDCSYFVQWTFKTHFDIALPRTAAQQAGGGKSISINNRSLWQPGDLIFYKDRNGKGSIGHVAIYLGNGQMIHALSKKHGTLIQNVDKYETWDANKLYCVKRYF